MGFDYEIQYKFGKENAVIDALYRVKAPPVFSNFYHIF